MRSAEELRQAAKHMSRDTIIEKLEMIGIACFASESDETLEEALVQNILDGTLDEDSLDGY